MTSELWQRLKACRKARRMTQAQVAERFGIDRVSVSLWESKTPETRTKPEVDKIRALAELFHVPADYLVDNNAPADPDYIRDTYPLDRVAERIPAYAIKTDEDPLADGDVQIDVADIDLAAGNGRSAPEFAETLYRHTYRQEFLRRVGVRDPSMVKRCRVVGDSMLPMLFHGDMVTVDTANKDIVDVGVYAIVIAGQIKVKRLIRQRDGSLVVRSENRAYADEIVPADELDDVFIIGRVIDKSGRGGLGF